MNKGKIVMYAGVAVDVIPAFIATCTQFPIWIDRSAESTVSGLFIVFACLSCIPFWRQIKEYMKSPSAWVMWTVALAVFICLQNIISEMVAVCFVGCISNIAGMAIYKVGNQWCIKIEQEKSQKTES